MAHSGPIDVIIYHIGCTDGMACVSVAYHYCRSNNYPMPKLIGIRPSCKVSLESLDTLSGTLLIVDVIPSNLNAVIARASYTIIIDHHKTNGQYLTDCAANVIIFNSNNAACVLTYKYFYPTKEIPLVIAYIEDRDIWSQKYPESNDLISSLISLNSKAEETIDMICRSIDNDAYTNNLLITGKRLAAKRRQMVLSKCREGLAIVNISFHNRMYRGVIFNDCYDLRSDIGNHLLETYKDLDLIVFWHWSETEGQYFISLRGTDGGVDIGEICKQYPDGGGHRNAAGFSIDGKIRGVLQHINTLLHVKKVGTLPKYN